MIKLIEISKKYKNELIFVGLNFEVERGDIIHISGTNGSGKTTLFKMISGLTSPDSGEVIIKNDVYIGALIENPLFIGNISAKDNIDFLFKLRSADHFNVERLTELFSLFELDYLSKKKVSKYSLGMKQKLGIIQAIMENQNLILLDEPTRGIDDESAKSLSKIIQTLSNEGKSIIIASHDTESALDIKFSKKYKISGYNLETA